MLNLELRISACLPQIAWAGDKRLQSKMRPSRHGHVYLSIVCWDYTTRTNHVTWLCISFTNCSKRCKV